MTIVDGGQQYTFVEIQQTRVSVLCVVRAVVIFDRRNKKTKSLEVRLEAIVNSGRTVQTGVHSAHCTLSRPTYLL